jgi:cytochrome c oxidase assembly protein subunit 15
MSVAAVSTSSPRRNPVGLWLLTVAVLVAGMVLLGGATRLTNSGLSIVEWKPVTGVVPPLSAADWQAEFDSYRQFPEYRKINRGMSLDEFRRIYWFEWSHRLLGRSIGAAFLLPFLWFLARRRIDRRQGLRLGVIFALGGLQGAVGWWMVASGLIDRPDVSHLRLATHLGLAVLLFGALLWEAWRLLAPDARVAGPRALALALPVAVFAQLLLGALVAGLDAGLVYNTFPTMNGEWIPGDLARPGPWWDNPTAVQFAHRLGAFAVAGLCLVAWARAPSAFGLVAAVVAAQFALGVLTLLHQVPTALGLLHQAGALALFAASLWAAWRTRPA